MLRTLLCFHYLTHPHINDHETT